MVLPHNLFPWLIRRGLWPSIPEKHTATYWVHMKENSFQHDVVPMWLWGDDAQYLESGEQITVVCCGLLLQNDTEKTTVKRCFPLFLYREDSIQNKCFVCFYFSNAVLLATGFTRNKFENCTGPGRQSWVCHIETIS